ncbi:HAMP domain-containing histidine kinase [Dehalobacter sp. DCM]|uniref:sensor histidine kinase n=1 Tax=Dehalobacter sp. DCM TaxID=2907827 RepID=UPI003081805F|nr:HAMP domain-containing histidine kinase [Dehalobacter sp. DCM]
MDKSTNSDRNTNTTKKPVNIRKIVFFPVYMVIFMYQWIREKIQYSIRLTLSFRYIGILLITMFGAGLAVILLFGGIRIHAAVQQNQAGIQEILHRDLVAPPLTDGELNGELYALIQDYCQENNVLLYADDPQLKIDLTMDHGFREYGSKSAYGIALNGQHIYFSMQKNFSVGSNAVKMVIYTDIQDELWTLRSLAAIMGMVYLVFLFLALIAIGLSGKGIFQPIKDMTRTVRDISEQNLNLRINVSGSKNELKELALTFNEMMNRLEDQYNRQKQFVSDASHELRTPIAVIQGYADMLDRWGKNDTEVLQESVTAIRNEAVNMQELIDKLLFLARHDNSTLEFLKEEFSLTELLQEIVRETEIIDKGHKIALDIHQEISVHADRARLKQAFRIFLDNALKYTPVNGEITVKAQKDSAWTEVSFKDNGIGMTQEELRRIFDRFYRSDQSRTKATGGYGLGLSIAKIIILGHNGKIKVRSKAGEGSEFIILL